MALCVRRYPVSTTALMTVLLTMANGASALQRTPFWRETARLHTAFCSRFPLTLSPDMLSKDNWRAGRAPGAGSSMSSVLRSKTCVRMAAASQSGAWLEASPALTSSLPPSLPRSHERSMKRFLLQILIGLLLVAFVTVPLAKGMATGIGHAHDLGLRVLRHEASDGCVVDVFSAASLYVLGKFTSNAVLQEPQNVAWLSRWFVCGMVDGACCHYWFYYLQMSVEKCFWITGFFERALLMNLTSTLIFTPTSCACFLALLSAMETASIKGALKRLRLDWLDLARASMKWDACINAIVFTLVPMALRVRVSMGAQFIYIVFLAIWDHQRAKNYKASRDTHPNHSSATQVEVDSKTRPQSSRKAKQEHKTLKVISSFHPQMHKCSSTARLRPGDLDARDKLKTLDADPEIRYRELRDRQIRYKDRDRYTHRAHSTSRRKRRSPTVIPTSRGDASRGTSSEAREAILPGRRHGFVDDR